MRDINSLDVDAFVGIQNNDPDRFEEVNWNNVEISIIDKLFPIDDGRYGRHPPPPSYRVSVSQLRNWRIENEQLVSSQTATNWPANRMRGVIRGEILMTPPRHHATINQKLMIAHMAAFSAHYL